MWGYVRNWQNVVANNNPLKYCGSLGHRSEGNTGLIYMRARYYDPATGRFESEDSAKDGANWSLYAHGDPVNMVDPDGRESLGETLIATSLIGGIGGGAGSLSQQIWQSAMQGAQIKVDWGVVGGSFGLGATIGLCAGGLGALGVMDIAVSYATLARTSAPVVGTVSAGTFIWEAMAALSMQNDVWGNLQAAFEKDWGH